MSKITHDPLKSVKDFEDFLKSVYDIDHILSSEEYRERRESTICAYPVVQRISEPFLGSAKDIEVANSIPIPDYGKAICFPYRFLGKPDVSAFPNQAGDKLSNTLDSIFFCGLNFHFFWLIKIAKIKFDNFIWFKFKLLYRRIRCFSMNRNSFTQYCFNKLSI